MRYLLVHLPVVLFITAQVQFNTVQHHGQANVDPSPRASTRITGAQGPAVGSFAGGKVLQKQTGVYRHQDGRREPAQDAEKHVGCFLVLEIGVVHESPGAKVSYRGDDASGTVENEETVSERDDDRGRDSLESGIEESERRMQRGRQRAQDVDQGGVRRHDDGRQRRNLWLRRGLRISGNGAISRHIVGENLVDAEDDVGE